MAHDWIPYATGMIVTVVGSALQAISLWRYDKQIRPTRQQLALSGDMTQLVCTVIGILPPALVLVRGTLLVFTVILCFAAVVMAVVVMMLDQLAPRYAAFRVFKIFMPASWLAFVGCGIGLLVALLT